jgi:hypothetical protein
MNVDVATFGRFPRKSVNRKSNSHEESTLIRRALVLASIAAFFVTAFATRADEDHVRWSSNGAPAETYITGRGWTLEQSGAANGLKSSGYCDSMGNQIGNPGTERMQPYYFPFVTGRGKHLQGYFD